MTTTTLADVRTQLSKDVEEVVSTFNHRAGTVRGMHYQAAPHEESKILWVTQGRLLDVLWPLGYMLIVLGAHVPILRPW